MAVFAGVKALEAYDLGGLLSAQAAEAWTPTVLGREVFSFSNVNLNFNLNFRRES
ncbi:hypothetical protein LF1_16760 [Rubripirellula obstinata]|uniref:Uncharacterized protein n=1 Tax=Rubripirellula obstinata TaxID=406547 RepID=A0A5B1CDB2_9BACT|nr:hypothetical protein LF1_16760 [Rubripirellula obstinata]